MGAISNVTAGSDITETWGDSVADYLNLSPHTVDAHLKHTYTKLNIHSRVELAVLALEHR